MRKRRILAIATLFFLGLLLAQDSPTPKDFAGTWEGTFKGAVFCVLKIDAGSEISGSLSPGRISTSDDGDLIEAEPSSSDAAFPILNPKIDGRVLTFAWKESGDDDVLKFEFKLTGESRAELRLIGMNRIKPLQLHRTQ